MYNLKIKVPNPCSQDWGNMNQEEKGRHCSSCDKIVVDFTSMGNDELKAYFKKHSEQRTCGHFLKSQLTHVEVKNHHFLYKVKNKFQQINLSPVRQISLILIGLLMTIAGCNEKTLGEVEYNDSLTEHGSNFDTSFKNNETTRVNSGGLENSKIDSLETLTVEGEVSIEDNENNR
jgi:hypothetical protein